MFASVGYCPGANVLPIPGRGGLEDVGSSPIHAKQPDRSGALEPRCAGDAAMEQETAKNFLRPRKIAQEIT